MCVCILSWHEIGIYDTASIIDHILLTTNQKQLIYIGHSQGTTSFLTLASMRPEYNEKLLDVHLLAPVSKLKNTRNKMYKTLVKYYKPLRKLIDILRFYKITLNAKVLSLLSKLDKIVCKQNDNTCQFIIELFLGRCHMNGVSGMRTFSFFFVLFKIDEKK